MDEQRNRAYRWLLYTAMLDIRRLQWAGLSWWSRCNPFVWRQISAQIRAAGYVAEGLHNLALFSALDFEHFEEARFWSDFQWILDRSPMMGQRYRDEFERQALTSENRVGG